LFAGIGFGVFAWIRSSQPGSPPAHAQESAEAEANALTGDRSLAKENPSKLNTRSNGSRLARGLAMLVLVVTLIGLAYFTPAASRLADGVTISDGSSANRLMVWRPGFRMIADAPGGWGRGNAANAFMQWYQPVDRLETYRNLLNSHLNWLVEGPWWFRFLYIFFWSAILRFCWLGRPKQKHQAPLPSSTNPPSRSANRHTSLRLSCAIGSAVWVSTGVAAFFTHTLEFWQVWVVPAFSFLAVFVVRVSARQLSFSLGLAHACKVVTAALLMCASLYGIGRLDGKAHPSIRKSTDLIYYMESSSDLPHRILVPTPERKKIGGRHYGYPIRKTGKPISVLPHGSAPSDLPPEQITEEIEWIYLGSFPSPMPSKGRLILVNPVAPPPESLSAMLPIEKVIWGAFRSRHQRAWKQAAGENFISVPGAADYLPQWPAHALEATEPPEQ